MRWRKQTCSPEKKTRDKSNFRVSHFAFKQLQTNKKTLIKANFMLRLLFLVYRKKNLSEDQKCRTTKLDNPESSNKLGCKANSSLRLL